MWAIFLYVRAFFPCVWALSWVLAPLGWAVGVAAAVIVVAVVIIIIIIIIDDNSFEFL